MSTKQKILEVLFDQHATNESRAMTAREILDIIGGKSATTASALSELKSAGTLSAFMDEDDDGRQLNHYYIAQEVEPEPHLVDMDVESELSKLSVLVDEPTHEHFGVKAGYYAESNCGHGAKFDTVDEAVNWIKAKGYAGVVVELRERLCANVKRVTSYEVEML